MHFRHVQTVDSTVEASDCVDLCSQTSPSLTSNRLGTIFRLQEIGHVRNDNICIIDLQAESLPKKNRILNPLERKLDEGIWHAFRSNDFSLYFQVYSTSMVNFQRPVDGLSILMAVAHHNRLDVLERLKSSTMRYELRDQHGHTAMQFASCAGHTALAHLLVPPDDLYVYDLYTSQGKSCVLPKSIATVSPDVLDWLNHTTDLETTELEHIKAQEEDSSDAE